MKKFALCVGAAAALLAIGHLIAQETPGKGAAKAPAGKRAPAGRPGMAARGMARAMTPAEAYELMVAELKLEDEQKTKLQEKVEAATTALEKWEKENGEALTKTREELQAARTARDAAKIAEAEQKLVALEAAKAKLMEENVAAMVALLNEEQKGQWEVAKLFAQVTTRLRAAELTDDQKPKIRELCAQAVKDIAAAETDAAKLEVRRTLNDNITKNILTDPQRAKLQAARPAVPGKARPAEGKPAPGPGKGAPRGEGGAKPN